MRNKTTYSKGQKHGVREQISDEEAAKLAKPQKEVVKPATPARSPEKVGNQG